MTITEYLQMPEHKAERERIEVLCREFHEVCEELESLGRQRTLWEQFIASFRVFKGWRRQ